MAWVISLHLQSGPDAIRTVRKLASAAARSVGASETDAYDVEVAVSEAVSNAHLHAYGGSQEGPIEVDMEFDGTNLTIIVHNSGKPVTDRMTVPRSLPQTDSGGRGLYLIGQLMDEVVVTHPDRDGRGTAVKMVKHIH